MKSPKKRKGTLKKEKRIVVEEALKPLKDYLTDELCNELSSRFEISVFVSAIRDNPLPGKTHSIFLRAQGTSIEIGGLLALGMIRHESGAVMTRKGSTLEELRLFKRGGKK